MKNVCIIGTGHVGLVIGACLAELDNRVICADSNIQKIKGLNQGFMPFSELGLEEMINRNTGNGRLSFTTVIEDGVKASDIIFIAAPTPPKSDGDADLSSVETVSASIGTAMNNYKVVVGKSTVPVKTGQRVKQIIKSNSSRDIDFDIVSNPEFLREGSAISDFMKPDRIIIGAESERAINIMIELYKPLKAPIVVTNVETAELIKYASNSFLTLKVSYINAIANICEKVGADIVKIAEGMGYDKRIGREFLNAGIGYGGPCLLKDVSSFIKTAEKVGYNFELLKVVQKINDSQREQIVNRAKIALQSLKDKTIGILGLSYKPGTDDISGAPSVDIIRQLQAEGARIKAYDPQAMGNAKAILQDVEYCDSSYQVAQESDALIIVTEWDEFKNLDLRKVKQLLKQPVIIDGRNIFNPSEMEQLGYYRT